MKDDRFPMCIEISFDVPYFENRSNMTNQQLADYVNNMVEEERCELVVAAKTELIYALEGEVDPAGLRGLTLEPGAGASLALGSGTDVNGTKSDKPVGRFARFGRWFRANGTVR